MSEFNLCINDKLSEAYDIDDFLHTIKTMYGIKVTEDIVAGTRIAMLTRPNHPDSTSVFQDECSLLIVDEDLNIVAKTIDRIYPYGHSYSEISTAEKNFPLIAEEWLPGIQVVVSKFKGVHLISTKDDIQGLNTVFPSGKSVAEIVVEKIRALRGAVDVDDLFNFGDSGEYMSWTFQLVPDNGDYELVLLSVFDLDTVEELDKIQLSELSANFGMTVPSERTVFRYEDMKKVMLSLYNINKDIKGVILRNSLGERTKVLLHKHRQRTRGVKGKILTLAEYVLNNNTIEDNNSKQIVELMQSNLKLMRDEVRAVYELYKTVRTKKKFVERVAHYPMCRVLYALKDGRINEIEELHKVVSPSYFVKLLNKVDKDKFSTELQNYKEILCQPEE